MKRINERGLAIIKHYEGLRLKAYLCPAGVWTIGYGSTKRVTRGMTCTPEEAEARLLADVEDAEACVNRVNVELTDDQFSALVSLVFNIGPTAFGSSTLRRKLVAGDVNDAAEQFDRWVFAAGKKLSGLIARRASERALLEGHGVILK